jgi:hypothetical protein
MEWSTRDRYWVVLRSGMQSERYEACTSDAATSKVRQLGWGSGLPFVKQWALLTTRPSITGDILASSTRHGTHFTTHSFVEQKQVMREPAQ